MNRNSTSVLVAGVALLVTPFLIPDHYVARVFPGGVSYEQGATVAAPVENVPVPVVPRVEHQRTPDAVKAIYMSQCAATTQSFRDSLFSIADETEVNAIVVDLKDYSGTVAFPSEVAIPGGEGCVVKDFRELVKAMHQRGIYVIGRLTVFQDPLYTAVHPDRAVQRAGGGIWRDNKGLAFVDVGATEYWDHVVLLAKEAHALGVDEVNFDYIRYPSDGPMREAVYSRTPEGRSHQEQLEMFFKYLAAQLDDPQDGHVLVRSADLFGMTTTNTDDLNIGQVLERALPYFDYIAPMVYPSHYPPNFNGYPNPNREVYGVVHFSMAEAVRRTVSTTTSVYGFAHTRIGTSTPPLYEKPSYSALKMRPWLQDFNYGGTYGPEEIRGQIQATYDAGLNSWMFWDPANRYTSLKKALVPSGE